jgi:hypothetical protein
MRCIVKAARRPPTGRIRDRNGGLPRLSGSVAHALRCPASRQRTLLAENLGKPSLWVMISDPWYKVWYIPYQALMLLSVLAIILVAAHLITLYTGYTLPGRAAR